MRKLLYLVLFAAAGVAITGASLTSVLGTGPGTLTKTLAGSTNNIPGITTFYFFNFTGASATQVKYITFTFPSTETVYNAQSVLAGVGFSSGTTFKVTNSGLTAQPRTATVILSQAQSLAGVSVSLEIAKFGNPVTFGQQFVTITTKDSSGNTIDNGTAYFYVWVYTSPSVKDNGTLNSGGLALASKVGIGTTGNATQRLEVNGTAQIDGNLTTSSINKEFKIYAPHGVNICIGNC